MHPFYSPPWRDPLFWIWVLIAALVLLFAVLYLGRAMTLDISGSATGHGWQNLTFAGENLTILMNGSGWNLTAVVP